MPPKLQWFTEIVDSVMRGATSLGESPVGTPQRLLEEVRLWAGRFFSSATSKWLPFYATVTRCGVTELREGVPFPCSNNAIGRCAACREPCCLHHAFVDQHGDSVCYRCIGRLIRATAPGNANAGGAPPPPPPSELRDAQVKRALAALGLKPGASWDEIRKKHRALAAKHHPDKAKGAADREKRQKACTAVNAALAELKRLDYQAGGS